MDVHNKCNHVIEARTTDVATINKSEGKYIIVDSAVPGDSKIRNMNKERSRNVKV